MITYNIRQRWILSKIVPNSAHPLAPFCVLKRGLACRDKMKIAWSVIQAVIKNDIYRNSYILYASNEQVRVQYIDYMTLTWIYAILHIIRMICILSRLFISISVSREPNGICHWILADGYGTKDVQYKWTHGLGKSIKISRDMKMSQFDLIAFPQFNDSASRSGGMCFYCAALGV